MAEDTMDLKTFIRDTLVQIVEGVEEARALVDKAEGTAVISPMVEIQNYNDPQEVQFDVAVTVSSSASGEGKAGIKVMALNIGGGGSVAKATEAVSRIQFSVPVAMPSTAKKRSNSSPPPLLRRDVV